jgi:outer membrane protein TolC
MFMTVIRMCVLVASVAAFGTPTFVYAQGAPAQPATAGPTPVRRLTADEAVRLAAENNLGIQVARYLPQIEDLNIAAARTGYAPSLTTVLQTNSTDNPNNSFLSGALGSKTSDDRFTTTLDFQKVNRWGGNYTATWDGSRSTTTNVFSNFSPQLRSSLEFGYSHPLLRGRKIDPIRQQIQISGKNREIADVNVRQTLATTSRTVRNAYWDLAYAIASLRVQQQSLELAQESLRNTRARIEIGTTPPIDIVTDEAEVAQRQEAVILAEAQIGTAEDTLRALVYDPKMPDFWTLRIEPAEVVAFEVVTVDVDAAVRNALDRRTDLQQARKSLEANDVSLRFLQDQTQPDVRANVNYGLIGLGGRQFQRGAGFPGPIIGESNRGFLPVLGDLFSNAYPAWTASLSINYPIGATEQQANLARARVQYAQAQAQIRNQELAVVTQVRQAAREVTTNQQRVQAARTARELAERRLDAEQRKFAAGTSTNFFVFQAQRDLAQARNNELRVILDYYQSRVDLDTVQDVPLR